MSKNLKVMIIDDHPLQLLTLERNLKSLGVTDIYPFTDARMAKKALDNQDLQDVDLIICDILMPEHDGVETMIDLHKLGYSGAVALLSAAESAILDYTCSMCDGFSFTVIEKLIKPATPQTLESLLDKAKKHRITQPAKKLTSAPEVLEVELLIGLAKGQFKNHYQPLVSFEDKSLVGVEALARWHHPKYGILTPNIFMPLIERCELFQELFDAVANNAIEDIASGKLRVPVSLNVDHQNLIDMNFANKFIDLCNENKVSPSQFTIEITERDNYQDKTALYKNLAQLRLHDVSIAIDDFGTGYSSLEKLASLSFNKLKIDRSFVKSLNGKGKNDFIVASICHLAKAMKIQLVAEGVEDEATWKLLRDQKVDICQGFYINKPMPLERLIA